MAELIKSPESMKKVREELAREISDNLIKISDLPHLLPSGLCQRNPEAASACTFNAPPPPCISLM